MPVKVVPPLPKEDLLSDLLSAVRKSNPKADCDLITKAYHFGAAAHQGQSRRSGEPYLIHPVGVATILTSYQLDTASIVTGLLHDTVEDTVATLEQVEKEFGSEVAALVDGVTKISKISFRTSQEKQAENFRKMIIAMAKDLRVIIVKLADRLHNMRTLEHLKAEKQVIVAQETLDIYSPLANRLGLSSMKRELEDLSFRYTKPEIFYKLVALVEKRLQERHQYVEDVQKMVEGALKSHEYLTALVTGRPKHLFSIHQKMDRKNLTFDQIYDITGFRLILDSVEDCYGVLGMIHSLWTPVPGRFKDYIAIPKANFYQSLHTTVIGPNGERVEFQIRTKQMHETAEKGIAAHWAYKEAKNEKDVDKFGWLNRLVESQRDLKDPDEFLESVKLDLFSDEVYVFTPKGEVMEFPQGATPLDFAYAVHTDLGNHCIGAKVNSRMVPLRHKLKSGDAVEIITSSTQTPNKDWLKIVRTGRAKNKIRQFIKTVEYEKSLGMGEMILERELKRIGIKLKPLVQDGTLLKIAEGFSYKNVNDLLSAVGYGKISPAKVITRIAPKEKQTSKEKEVVDDRKPGVLERFFQAAKTRSSNRSVVKVKGVEDLLVRFARCCNPVPGDPVTGFITRGRGISVHSRRCPKIFDTDPHRLVDIEWDLSTQAPRRARIRIVCEDRPGLLADMSQVIKEQSVNITRAQIGTTRDKKAVCHFTISIQDIKQLNKVISTLEGVPGVMMVERVKKTV